MRGTGWLSPAVLVLTLQWFVAPAMAQTSSLEIETVDTSAYPEIRIEITLPSAGRDLPAEAFSLLEAGEARPVRVEPMPTDDLRVILLMDTSGSMAGGPIEAARVAAARFLAALPEGSHAAVVAFGSTPELVVPFTRDLDEAAAVLEGLEARGQTALYDALVLAAGQFDASASARRVIVLLSDGGDTVSEAGLPRVVHDLSELRVRLYAIELQSPEIDSQALMELASTTGGQVVPAEDPAALDQVYETIASLLVNRYAITYLSESHGSTLIRVGVADGGFTAEVVDTLLLPEPLPTSPATSVPAFDSVAPETVEEPSGRFETDWAYATGVGALYFALALLFLVVLVPQTRTVNLSLRDGRRFLERRTNPLSSVADRATLFVERALENRAPRSALDSALERAGILLRPAEFVLVLASGVVAAFLLGGLLGGLIGGISLAILVLVSGRLTVALLTRRRQAAFADQLDDLLQLLAGSLRAGYGLLQAVDSLSREAERPAAEELRRVVLETRLGRDLVEALRSMAERLDNLDFEWVVEAIEIHQQVGGDLAEVLENVGATIRDRNQIRRQVKALSAEGRLSAVILLVLPFVVGFAIALIVPGYMNELFETAPGRLMLVLGSVLMVIGGVWIRRIVRIVF